MNERTVVIVKPDAVQDGNIGNIIACLERNDLHPIGIKMHQLTKREASLFYCEHCERDIFPGLIEYMTSGPVVFLVVEGEDAVSRVRELVGATNPQNARAGTLRQLYGSELPRNAIHASDSFESVKRELAFCRQYLSLPVYKLAA